MPARKQTALRRRKGSGAPGTRARRPLSPKPPRELTHAEVMSGNEQEQELIRHIDQTGERDPDQQGDTANIRQNTTNVNRKHMR